ncbi:MAG: NUDIX domain-containing protein [Candidatus Diapherotrites archaeon]|nr:NUDIX domain-containing protein [Candidatus Diapherotrites archaeon]
MTQDPFAVTVKAFVVNAQNKLLLVKRPETAVHKSGVWEIPGGRLSMGENPFDGLKREVLEEVGLDIEVLNPLKVHHFTRQDGQKITMIVFVCKALSENVKLSSEHTVHKWIGFDEAKFIVVPDFLEEIKLYQKFFQGKI